MAASVQSMCEYWKKFDLQELQKELDSTATDLANRQDASDASRKRLVDLSRDFKKNTPEDIRKVVAPLLKNFQGEIDALSKRSKSAEAAFLSVYKRLIDLPDPVQVLEYALQIQKKAQRVQDLEIENKQLRETLDEYNHEFAEVKNQEVTIKQLKEKLKDGEDKIEAVAEARTKEKERELQKQFAEKERQLQETQLTVARKLGEAEQRVATLTNALENVQSELFEVKAKYDEATSAKSDEMEMVMADLERANERATAAEREGERLKQQLGSVRAGLGAGEGGTGSPGSQRSGADMEQAIEILQRSNLEAELAAKEKEISQLVEDVQRLQASLQQLRDNTAQQVSRLEEELSTKNKAFRALEERLRSQEDYEEIKRELSVLKSIEFSSPSPTDEVDGDASAASNKSKSLEMLLLEKNKALQSENTQLKVTCSDVSGNSSPALSSNAEAFVSMLGEEIATSYKSKNSPDASSKLGLSSSPAFSAVSPKKDSDKTMNSPESGDIPPQVPSSPHSDIHRLVRSASVTDTLAQRSTSMTDVVRSSSVSEHLRLPPPSPQFFHPSFTNNPLLANYMNMGMNLTSPKSDINGCQGLDTSMVAKTVRELLSIHNIGQRLFAKHVLGLSQGTVSELLSKPKSWDKLTEKGRESYRKMHSWAVDDRNILALKAISPKKGERHGSQPLLPSIQREDAATEERIAQILNDAQNAMQSKKSMEQAWAKEQQTAMVNSLYQEMAASYGQQFHGNHSLPITSHSSLLPSHHPALNGGQDRFNKLRNDPDARLPDKRGHGDVSSKEMVERIYRQELMKLATAAENAGNIAAATLYQQELARLAQQARIREDPEPGEVRHMRGSQEDRLKVKTEPQDSSNAPEDLTNQSNGPIDLSKHSTSSSTPSTPTSGGSDKSLNNSAHTAGSAFFQVRPKINGHGGLDTGRPGDQQPTTPSPAPHTAFTQHHSTSDTTSPLQRMQNIANSLMTRPHMGQPCNKPLKAVLPPITQEEFDNYANVNTEDLVKQVKETLSQYSISQRLFGENVLGLSQGSVSDLLARPKPWHMLTQKGREPFIRMQLFLEDAEAIPKLVASQYHIAPDKLMRSNSVTKDPNMEGPVLWPGLGPTVLDGTMAAINSARFGISVPQSDMKPVPPPPPPPPPPPSSRPPNVPLMLPNVPVSPGDPHHSLFTHHHHLQQQQQHPLQQQHPNWNTFSYPSSMLEVVAMTSEIDTLDLTGRVKDVLQFNNLGQKLFGEAVLGLSQGSVSELLSKPKPWHMLSIKGREPFIKMHLWLSDPHNVERLKHFQNEIKANRRRRHSIEDRYDSPMALPKRPRVFFSEEQKERLRQAYNRDPYPNQSTIEALAQTLNVGVKTVINWFHNHRMRAKQQQHATSPTSANFNEFSEQSMGKSESMDDNSNNSDISSISEDTRDQSRFHNSDSNQWMFPQFEPVNLKREAGDNNNEGSDEGMDQDEVDGDVPSPSSAKDLPQDAKDSDKEECMELGKDENSNMEIFGDKTDRELDISKGQGQSVPHSGANKRKRSHPQYVSAGRHLDRTINQNDNEKNPDLFHAGDEVEKDTEKENDYGNTEESLFVKNLEKVDQFNELKKVKVEKIEDGNLGSNIEKMQKHLTQHSGEDWEI